VAHARQVASVVEEVPVLAEVALAEVDAPEVAVAEPLVVEGKS
jgi:hypothetical protein